MPDLGRIIKRMLGKKPKKKIKRQKRKSRKPKKTRITVR